MRISNFVAAVDQAITEKRLREPFRASDIRKAIPPPRFAFNTYNQFLPKHVKGNGQFKEYFQRIEPGLYRRLRR